MCGVDGIRCAYSLSCLLSKIEAIAFFLDIKLQFYIFEKC